MKSTYHSVSDVLMMCIHHCTAQSETGRSTDTVYMSIDEIAVIKIFLMLNTSQNMKSSRVIKRLFKKTTY